MPFKRWLAFGYGVGLAALAACGAMLRFWNLDRLSLWQDEIHTALYVTDHPTLSEVIHRVATWDLHAPVYYVLLRLEVWALGLFHLPLSGGHLRVLSAVLGCLALGAVFAFSRRVFEHRGWALLAFALAALNVYAVYYSQDLRMYAAILAAAPAVLYFQLRLWDTEDGRLNLRMAAGYVLCGWVLLYSSLIGLFFVTGTGLALGVTAWLERKAHPKRWPTVLALGGILVAGYLPWLSVMWRQSRNLSGGVVTGLVITQPRELLKFAFENLWLHAWKIGPGFSLVSKIARLLMPLALLNLLDPAARRRHGLVLLGFALTFLVYYAATFNKPFHTGRYFAAWWPWGIYFLVAGFTGLTALLRKVRPAWAVLAPLMAVAFGGGYLWVQSQQLHYYFTAFEKEDYRAAAAWWQANPGKTLLVKSRWYRECFEYYGVQGPYLTLEDFKQNPSKHPGLVYIGVIPVPDDPEMAGLSGGFEKQAWGIGVLNLYTWNDKPPASSKN